MSYHSLGGNDNHNSLQTNELIGFFMAICKIHLWPTILSKLVANSLLDFFSIGPLVREWKVATKNDRWRKNTYLNARTCRIYFELSYDFEYITSWWMKFKCHIH